MIKKEEIEKKEEKISILLEDLAFLERYIRDLFSFLPLPICLISSNGIILEANPAFEKISGYRIEEIIGRPAEDIFDKREVEEILKETLEKGSIKAKETSIFTSERGKIPVSISTNLRKSEEGEIIGYFISSFDLTEVKKAQEELQKKVRELEKFYRVAVGRELKMIELKKEIKRLKEELKK